MDEITAEFCSQELIPVAKLLKKLFVTIACKTDLGRVRENNEDKFEYYIPEDEGVLAGRGMVFLVCDGMGGHAAGQIASELTVKTFIDVYLHHPAEQAEVAAEAAVMAANRYVFDVGRTIPSRRGMGTTLSGLILIQDEAMTVQVGDSRIYRLREDDLQMLTEDHTWIEEAVKSGAMSREEAEVHPYKHVLTRAIGTEEVVVPDIARHKVQPGDTFLLCSDGLNNHVSDQQIADIMAATPPSEAAWKLVATALADGGSDNCTVTIVRIDRIQDVEQS